MSIRPHSSRTALAALLAGAAACADRQPLAPESLEPAARPSADIIIGPGLPCAGCVLPDHGKILYTKTVVTRKQGNFELFKADATGDNAVRLTSTAEGESQPAWSPSYHKIAFVRAGKNNMGDLYVMNADGTGVQQLTNTPETDERYPTWMPGGTGLLFTADVRSDPTYKFHVQLGSVNADGSGYKVHFPHLPGVGTGEACAGPAPCTRVTEPGYVGWPHMSPNGRDVVYVTYNPVAQRHGIRVIDFYDQTNPAKKRWLFGGDAVLPSPYAAGPSFPRFSPAGDLVSFVFGTQDVQLVDAATGAAVQTFKTGKAVWLSGAAWSPDGSSLMVHNGTDASLLRLDRTSGTMLPVFGTAGAMEPGWHR
jgi:Tol biopolymer transport system component